MAISKGKWEATGTTIMLNGDYRFPLAHVTDPDKPMHTTPTAEANADIIVTAINACQEVNQDNPMAVAESIKDMYEFCRELLMSLDTGYERLGAGREGSLRQVVAKVERRE